MRARSSRFLALLFHALAAPSLISCGSDPDPGSVTNPGNPGTGATLECRAAIAPKDSPLSSVTIRFRNSSDAPRYLGGLGCQIVPFPPPPFHLKDSNGKELTWTPLGCSMTCEDALNGFCSCMADCRVSPVYMIPPGSAYEMVWSGAIFTEISLPEDCASFGCSATCLRKEAAPEGTLEFTASVFTEAKGCGAMPCSCDPGANHYCQLIDGPVTLSGEEHTASATLDYPSGKFIEIVFP